MRLRRRRLQPKAAPAPNRGRGPGTAAAEPFWLTTTLSSPRAPEPGTVLNKKFKGVELLPAVNVPLYVVQVAAIKSSV